MHFLLFLTLWNLLLFFILIYSCKWFPAPNTISSCCQIWLWMCRKCFISTCFRVTLALKLLWVVACCWLLFRLLGLLWSIFVLLETLILLVDLVLLSFVLVSAALQLLHLLVQQLRQVGLRSFVTELLFLFSRRRELALRILFSIALWIHTFLKFWIMSWDDFKTN